jgi:hypothetical protein
MGNALPRIGVTGHTRLTERTARTVYVTLCEELVRYRPATLHGVTCLAPGADQLFARAVLAAGGTFDAIVPAADYRDDVVDVDDRPGYDELVGRAASVIRMPFARSGTRAYLGASQELLRRCDELLAVWDGSTAEQLGVTAEVVATARSRNVSVRVLWPADAVRF